MNRFLLPLLLIVTSLSAIAQKQAFNSAYSFGSGLGLDDEVTDAYHQGKYIYTIGYFSGSVDFDPSDDVDLLAVGWEGEDIYFAKYDTLDNLIWVKQLTSETKDEGLGITADKSGNVYICGLFKSKIDLDPSRDTFMLNVHTAGTDGFVAKYDSSGNFKWGYAIGQNRTDAVVDIATDNNNNCIITGYFCDTIDIDPGSGTTLIESSPRKDLFLIQYDSLGNLNWGFSVGNDDLDDVGEVLHVDKLGNIYLSGTFHKTVDFDPSSSSNNLKSAGDKDVFMAKYTKNGAHIWSKHIEGRDDEEVTGMAVNDGKIWLSGEFEGMCDFDPSSSTYFPSFRGYKDVFVSCYDTTGSFNWAHSFGANGTYTYSNGVAADDNGNCYLASFSGDYIDWDPSKKTYSLRGRDDVILSSYSSNGNFRWAHKLGGTKIDKARAVISIGSSVACYGYFDTKAQFDPSNNAPNLLSTGNLISSEGASGFHARYAFNGKYMNAFSNTDDLGNSDLVYSVANDKIGNTYVGGHITGIVDMDHRDNHSHYLDGRGIGKLLLARYDTNMVLNYAIDFASTGDAQLRDLVVDDSLNLYFTGIFEDTLFLGSKYKGKRIISKGLNDAIFGKINSNGKLVWIKQFGGTSRTYGHSIDLDSKGNIIISGGFAGNTDFDPSSGTSTKNSAGNYDAFIAKYSNNGAFNWVINIGNSEHDFCNDVKVGPTDEIIATGSFQYSCNFNRLGSNVRRTSWGDEDIFICKYNSKGQVQWLRTHGNSQSDIGFALDIDNKGNVYTTGSFSGKTDFDFSGKTHELIPSGRSDIFLLALDSLGNYKWAHKYGSKSTGSGENGRAITYNNGRIYMAGTFNDTTDFDPSSKTYYLYQPNVFLAIMDTLGNFEEAHSYGSHPQPEELFDISFSKNALYLCGAYRYDTDFDPSNTKEHFLLNKRGTDGYVLKLNVPVSCRHSFSSMNISQCGSYTLPSGNETVTKSGTYYDVIKNHNGCDSNIIITYMRLDNLINSDVSVCLAYNSPGGKTYTQSGIYYDTLTNINNCDSIIVTNLTINGNYNLVQTTACDSLYLLGTKQWVKRSGLYIDSFKNQLGCDSLIEIDLAINSSYYSEEIKSACSEFTLPSSNRKVVKSGLYLDSFKTQSGCDSVLAWNVTINKLTQETLNQQACQQFYLEGSQRFVSVSGTYKDTLSTINKCDSIITWNLTITQPTHDTLNKAICDSFYLNGSGIWVNQSGLYTDSLKSNLNCDSVITWNISKSTVEANFEIIGDSLVADSINYDYYQWFRCGIDTAYLIEGANTYYYKPTKTDNYALAVVQNKCSELSDCKKLTVVSIFEKFQNIIKLYPNPTTGVVQIQVSEKQENIKASLYSINGKILVEYGNLNNGTTEIDLSNYSSGSYILYIEGDNGEVKRELIMKK